MDYNRLQELLEKYTEGATSVTEEKLLKTYFDQHDNVHPDFKYAQGIFTHFIAEKKNYFLEEEIKTKKSSKLRWIVLLGILVLFVSFMVCLNYLYSSSPSQKTEEMALQILHNTSDTVQKVPLNNHTTIWLKQRCILRYSSPLGGKKNILSIEGEAFLKTTVPDSINIIAYNALINVAHSSAFNIKAEKGAESVEITVKYGSIHVADNNNSHGFSLLVTEGNYCSVHKSSKMVFAAANTNNNYLAWLTGVFVFDHIPLATVTDILERYYHVKVNLEDRQLAYCEITGTFKTLRIDTILNAIKSELNFEITNAGNVITISGKDCS